MPRGPGGKLYLCAASRLVSAAGRFPSTASLSAGCPFPFPPFVSMLPR
jgi:hypothetical protein